MEVWKFRSRELPRRLPWADNLAHFSDSARYLAQVRGTEVCVTTGDTRNEVAWLPCPAALGARTGLVPHPSGRAWAGGSGPRLCQFVLEN